MTATQKITQRIDAMIATANGLARERKLSTREIAQVLSEAIRDGHGYTTGGSVAKSRAKWGRAETTVAFAVANGPDYIAIKMSRINALSRLPVIK